MVGTSFKLGYRFQRYWGDSMAIAFFAAEAGVGLFLVSLYFDFVLGMAVGLAFAGTLKPYFHLAHMGVPQKSMRALLRPDRSWISRGALAIGFCIVPGIFYTMNVAGVFAFADIAGALGILDVLAQYICIIAALFVVIYQGMAMQDSESLTLWASPLLPVSSALYAFTCGSLLTGILGWNVEIIQQAHLIQIGLILLIADLAVVAGILNSARKKSEGGAYSVEMLMKTNYAPTFRNMVFIVGLIAPIVILAVAGNNLYAAIAATAAMLVGFYYFRIYMFKAAVFEPITDKLVASLGWK